MWLGKQYSSLYTYMYLGRELGASEYNLLILISMSYRYPSHFADEQTGSDVAHITQPGSGAESDITAMLLK